MEWAARNSGSTFGKSLEDLIVDASSEAFEDAGVQPDDIQAAWLGFQYSFASARGTLVSSALKLNYIPITRVENACCTGTDAFRNACYGVAAGIYDLVLVVGAEKQKDANLSGLPISFAPFWGYRVEPPVPAPTQFALAATRYFEHYGIPYEEGKRLLAKIAVKNHKNGAMNPKAHLRRPITLEQVVKAPIISSPWAFSTAAR